MEIWKDVIGFEDTYKVSNYGNVMRIAYFDNASNSHHASKLLKPMKLLPYKNGYLSVKLTSNGKSKKMLVHRIVAEAFIKNPENKSCVNHINFDRANNCVYNLEWVTHKENVAHSQARITLSLRNKKGSKPVYQYTKNWEYVSEYPSANEAARTTDFYQQHICNCCNGKTKSHKGYYWSYEKL